MRLNFLESELEENVDDVAIYLTKKDLGDYDKVLDTAVSRVYKTYYLQKLDVLNDLISHFNNMPDRKT